MISSPTVPATCGCFVIKRKLLLDDVDVGIFKNNVSNKVLFFCSINEEEVDEEEEDRVVVVVVLVLFVVVVVG